jgi:hypothetical protein
MFEIRIARSLAEARIPRPARTPEVRRVYKLPNASRPARQAGPR